MALWIARRTLRFAHAESTASLLANPRRGTHLWTVWERPAADKAEALKCAEKAGPRVDLGWMAFGTSGILIHGKDLA